MHVSATRAWFLAGLMATVSCGAGVPAALSPSAPPEPSGPSGPTNDGPAIAPPRHDVQSPRPQPTSDAPQDPFSAAMLAAHNRVRREVRPAGSTPLPPLEWDDSLATLAAAWTNRCPDGHRPNNTFGENIYWSGGMAATADAAVASWAEEARYYDYDSTVCSRDGRRTWSACGHYTQLVWRETRRVGCAVRTNCPGDFENVVVCNYDPPGNVNVSSTSIPRPY